MTESSKGPPSAVMLSDDLLHQARQLTPRPSPALLARIEADAQAVARERSANARRVAATAWLPWRLLGLHGVWRHLRHWRDSRVRELRYLAVGLAGLAIGLTGVTIGMTYSADLLMGTAVQSSGYDLDDLLPGYGLDVLVMTAE